MSCRQSLKSPNTAKVCQAAGFKQPPAGREQNHTTVALKSDMAGAEGLTCK